MGERWKPFNYKPEKSEASKFKKDLSIKSGNLKFNWRKINIVETKYKINDFSNLRWQVKADDLDRHSTMALFTIEW